MVSHVNLQLSFLENYLKQFRQAVQLIRSCRIRQSEAKDLKNADTGQGAEYDEALFDEIMMLDGWMHIAARDAVMTVYHFGSTLEALRRNTGKAASMRKLDAKRMKAAWKRFRDVFPAFEALRHAVAHMADEISTMEKRHEITPANGIFIGAALSGHTYFLPGKDKALGLRITDESAIELEAVLMEVWAAFEPVSLRPPGPD